MDLDAIRAVLFDCHGVLIDRDGAVRAYVTPRLRTPEVLELGEPPTVDAWLARWTEKEAELLAPWRPYAEVLVRSYDEAMHALGLPWFSDGGPGLAYAVAEWHPVPGATPALRRIARRRRLGLVTNADRVHVAGALGQLLLPVALVVSAEDAGACLPAGRPLALTLEHLGLPPGAVLYVGADERSGLAAARRLGMGTCRIGAVEHHGVQADLAAPTLSALADLLGR